jgi:formyl-CoA transferase
MVGATFPPRRTRFTTLNPLVNQYQARDGQRFIFCCLDTVHDWGRICRAIERHELITDERYATVAARSERTEEIVVLLDEAIGKRDFAEWEKIFHEQGLIWGIIPTMDRVAADPQMKANGVFTTLEHPQHGSLHTISSPLNVQGIKKAEAVLAPAVGEHSLEILQSLGYSDSAIGEMLRRGVTLSSEMTDNGLG